MKNDKKSSRGQPSADNLSRVETVVGDSAASVGLVLSTILFLINFL